MPGLITPISSILIDPSGERTTSLSAIPGLWKVRLPSADTLLDDCGASSPESRCANSAPISAPSARRRGIPVIVDVDCAMSLQEGLLTASSHLCFPASRCRRPQAPRRRQGVEKDRKAEPRHSWLARAVRAARSGSTNTAACRRHGLPVHTVDTLARRRLPWRLCGSPSRKSRSCASVALASAAAGPENAPARRALPPRNALSEELLRPRPVTPHRDAQ